MRLAKLAVLLTPFWPMLCAASAARGAPLYAFSTLATFNVANGDAPIGNLIADSNGNLYGAATGGGSSGSGVVYEVSPTTGAMTVLANFPRSGGISPDGYQLSGGLFADSSGNLYGTALFGGSNLAGTVYEVATGTGAISAVTFNGTNGEYPNSVLIPDTGGNLYGIAEDGGAHGAGTIFELAAGSQTLTALASFNEPSTGQSPFGELIADANGNFYGTAFSGGVNGDGTVFELTAQTHSLIALASFNGTDGSRPSNGLLADPHGNFYGTTQTGGAYNDGTVFELNPNTGALTTLFSFNGTDGAEPDGTLIFNSNGQLLGTTFHGGPDNDGTVFELDPTSSTLTTLFDFTGTTDEWPNGAYPEGALLLDGNGDIFGTTTNGGAVASDVGTVFELAPVPEPSSLALIAIAGFLLIILQASSRRPAFIRPGKR